MSRNARSRIALLLVATGDVLTELIVAEIDACRASGRSFPAWWEADDYERVFMLNPNAVAWVEPLDD